MLYVVLKMYCLFNYALSQTQKITKKLKIKFYRFLLGQLKIQLILTFFFCVCEFAELLFDVLKSARN